MKTIELLNKYFPAPKYLEMPALGVDISDRSIKFAEFKKNEKHLELGRYGRAVIPEGLIQSGEIVNADQLKSFLKTVFKDLAGSSIILSLPEERAFVGLVTLPKMAQEDIRPALELSLEEHIPLPASDAIFDFEIIPGSMGEDHLDVALVAFPRKLVEDYVSVADEIGLHPIIVEMEAQALSRAVLPAAEIEPIMVVDFGRTRSSFIIVSSGVVRFTSTVKVAGEALDNSIAKAFSIDPYEAERVKKEKGFIRTKENQEVFNALLPVVSAIRDEIERHLNFWKNHASHVHHGGNDVDVKKIYLTGGDVNLTGLPEYLTYELKIPVKLADPWVNIVSPELYIPEVTYRESLSYATALGLALRAFSHD